MKICVFVHLFYTEMLDELLEYVQNLSDRQDIEYDLVVTLCAHHAEIEQKIYAFKDDAKILIVENRGYDVAPFLQAVKSVHLHDYDYLIKLHSKRNLTTPAYLPTCCLKGDEWRKKLLEFMSTPAHLESTLRRFQKNPKIGMITAPELIVASKKMDIEADKKAEKIMRGMGLTIKDKHFVAGTMFIARADLFRLFKHLPYDANDFEEFDPSHKGGSLAHALERVLGYMITAQGYKIAPYHRTGLLYFLKIFAYRLKNFIFYKRVNSKGKLHIKICKIPVYSKQIT